MAKVIQAERSIQVLGEIHSRLLGSNCNYNHENVYGDKYYQETQTQLQRLFVFPCYCPFSMVSSHLASG